MSFTQPRRNWLIGKMNSIMYGLELKPTRQQITQTNVAIKLPKKRIKVAVDDAKYAGDRSIIATQ